MSITKKNRSRFVCAVFGCILLLAFIGGCSKSTTRFQATANNDDYSVYNTILDRYSRSQKHLFYIEPMTTLRELKMFNLKDPKYHRLDTVTEKRIYQSDWKAFLSKIDLDKKLPGKLILSNFKGERFKVLPTRRFKSRFNLEHLDYDPSNSVTIFSPVFLSEDKTKAVCSVMSYSGPEASSTNIFFLEKINNRWEIVDFIMMSIS